VNEKLVYSGQIADRIEEGYNGSQCPQQPVVLKEEEEE
jgi:hypothetical protein